MKKYINRDTGVEIIVKDEVQEAAVQKYGFEFKEEVTEEAPKKK